MLNSVQLTIQNARAVNKILRFNIIKEQLDVALLLYINSKTSYIISILINYQFNDLKLG